MTLTFKLDLDKVKINHHAKCLGQRSFMSKVILYTHSHLISCSTWTTQVVHIESTRLPFFYRATQLC